MGAQMQALIARHPAWAWLRAVRGVGSVLAARLLARLDISRAPVASVVLGVLRSRHGRGGGAGVRGVRRAGVRGAGHAGAGAARHRPVAAVRAPGRFARAGSRERARRAGEAAARRARRVRPRSEDDLLSDRRVVRAVRRAVSRRVRRAEAAPGVASPRVAGEASASRRRARDGEAVPRRSVGGVA